MPNSKCLKLNTIRSNAGVFLIELLVALVIASLLALALCASIAEMMRMTSTIEGKELAAIMAQQVLERVKNIPFDADADGIRINNATTYDLVINDTDPRAGTQPCAALARPLLLDLSKFQYTTLVSETNYHKFKGRVTLNMGDGPLNPYSNTPIAGTKTVTIHVIWSEPNATVPHDLELKSVLYRYGIQHHGG